MEGKREDKEKLEVFSKPRMKYYRLVYAGMFVVSLIVITSPTQDKNAITPEMKVTFGK